MSDVPTREANGGGGAGGVIHAPARPRHTRISEAPRDVHEPWQGATVAALSLLPVATVAPGDSIHSALEASRAHQGQCVLIVDDGRMHGYVDMVDLVAHASQEAVHTLQHKFVSAREGDDAVFQVIHAQTPLADVAQFLESAPFALVTDEACQRVTNLVMPSDLARYADAAGIHAPLAVAGRRAEEEARRDGSVAEILRQLEGYAPLIPDEVSDYYLERAGFQCDDVRLKRLLALATEKFVSDIASDAFQYARIRTNAGPGRAHRTGGAARDRARTVLTMDDLSAALGEYGIDARRAETFR